MEKFNDKTYARDKDNINSFISNQVKNTKNTFNKNNINSDKNIIRPSQNGRYNLNFIDWNNEWERVSEIEMKIENGEEISDKEEEERVRSNMIKDQVKNSQGVSVQKFQLVIKPDKTKECYICLKNFSLNIKIRKLPCNHMFCQSCLIPWLKSNYVCPTCKFKLKSDNGED